jgi:prolyl oligopeptidase
MTIKTRRDPVTETLHGRQVTDPYRWLEDGDDLEVQHWILHQNDLTESTLAAFEARSEVRSRLEQLLKIGYVSLPAVRRTANGTFRYFYTHRSGDQNQPILLVRDGLDGTPRTLVDPNRLSTTGGVALDWYVPCQDGSLVAYGQSTDGTENSTLFVCTADDGRTLSERIERTRHASVAWTPDGSGFYYSRYPEPGTVPSGEEHYHRRIYLHRLGEDPALDALIFGAGRAMTDFPTCEISPGGRWLLVRVHQGWSKSQLFLLDTSDRTGAFVEMTEGRDHLYDAIVHDDVLYVHTNEGAPRYAVYRVDPGRPRRPDWELVIAERTNEVLETFHVTRQRFFVSYLDQGVSKLERLDAAGRSLDEVRLPSPGTVQGLSGLHDSDELFFDFESFSVVPTVYRLAIDSSEPLVWEQARAPRSSREFVVTRAHATSKDGTEVPYLMVHEKGIAPIATGHPTLLYGYGGFNVALKPRFSRTNYLLLERGLVYVQANLRGGSELGEDWHRSGQLDKKQNVFDDFIAVAEDLVARKITQPSRLAIIGHSNGGLLTAAAVTQRPELFRAAVCAVPLTDMLRYHRFLLAKLWIPEYGSPDDPAAFEWLHAYSPYHRVTQGTAYPAVLVTTALGDSRVDPMHARKFSAALQHATSSERPVLLRTETKAGHGAGKPITKLAEEYADIQTFVLWQLGVLE